jgi:hypothetical protein
MALNFQHDISHSLAMIGNLNIAYQVHIIPVQMDLQNDLWKRQKIVISGLVRVEDIANHSLLISKRDHMFKSVHNWHMGLQELIELAPISSPQHKMEFNFHFISFTFLIFYNSNVKNKFSIISLSIM